MKKGDLFEYATIRIVPLVDREEFINTGVILYCKAQNFLEMKFEIDEKRLSSFRNNINIGEITQHLEAFVRYLAVLQTVERSESCRCRNDFDGLLVHEAP
ncbi:MAG: DUF3037 domain-containing protein [Bacteroidota bacterium]